MNVFDNYFYGRKGNVFLWSDNDPYYWITTHILNKHYPEMKMIGDYYGCKII